MMLRHLERLWSFCKLSAGQCKVQDLAFSGNLVQNLPLMVSLETLIEV